MNIIHSSSLAYQPAGYIKPDNAAVSQSPKISAVNDGNGNKPGTDQASTPEQIQNALQQAGLSEDNSYNQPADSRTARALAAYSQTRNQSIHSQLSETIFGLDLYA